MDFYSMMPNVTHAANEFRAILRGALVVLPLVALAACDRPPSVELKEWTPADHDGEKKSPSAKQGQKGDPSGPDALVELTWRNQCATCHGAQGKGDGPQGPMFRPRDLTQADWQKQVTDEDIVAAITAGKGRMPKFDLPEPVVRGLVTRVRALRAE